MNNLAVTIGERLLSRGERLALAESCTGGLIAKLITDVAGSSEWFERGLVTYSNAAKQELLNVPAEVIAREGAVSEAAVRGMAEGLLSASPADWAIAVTGIAGPGGGTPDKPVGTVWVAWVRRGQAAETRHFLFAGDRAQVREQTAEAALEGLLARLRHAA